MYSQTRTGAAAKWQALLEQQRQGLPVAVDQPTVAEFLAAWLEDSCRVALTLGLRLSKVQGLRWEDVALDAGTPRDAKTVRSVGGRLVFGVSKTRCGRRNVLLPEMRQPSLADHLARQRAERARAGGAWSECGRVFATRGNMATRGAPG